MSDPDIFIIMVCRDCGHNAAAHGSMGCAAETEGGEVCDCKVAGR